MPGLLVNLIDWVPSDDYVKLNYTKPSKLYETETAFQTFLPIHPSHPDQRRHNVDFESSPEPQRIRDVRGREEEFDIDVHGFQYFKHKSQLTAREMFNKKSIKEVYLPEVAKLLQERLQGADHVILFDWRLRHAEMNPHAGRQMDYSDELQRVGPTPRAHIASADQTDAGVMRRLERHVGGDVWKLLKGRLRMINVWRPIYGPVEDCPLAVCDGRTYPREGIVGIDMHKPGFLGQSAGVQYRDGMEWYYMSRQMDDEPVVFKNFDSEESVTPYSVHTAFTHSKVPENALPRQSVEVRAIVFTDPEGKQSVSIRTELDE
ncbi:hypothetical protein LTR15_003609 [Elasticomyces elasticus]|nr:hypothetical protein LTR15_003609 [Elasticomyces elasticus]